MKILKEVLEKNREAGRNELRKFGFIFSLLLILIVYFIFPWLAGAEHRQIRTIFISLAISIIAFLWPIGLRPLFILATFVATILGAINNRILLACIFFLVLTPLAFFRRILGTNAAWENKESLESYRIICAGRDSKKNKERIF